MPDWTSIRADFPALKRFRYFISASGGPMPRPVYEKAVQYYRDVMEVGDCNWKRNIARLEEIRALAARLIHADVEEIEFVSSTAAGMNVIAGLLSAEGDVLATSLEFPDTTLPWLHRRPDSVRWVQPDETGAVPPDRFQEKMTNQTAVIATSHVQFSNGFRQDLERLGALKGRHFLVANVTQSLGAFEVDVRRMQIDALCGNSYKWMLAGYGCGILYVSRHLIPGRPVEAVGWFATRDREGFRNDSYELLETAARFNLGCPAFPPIFSLGAALEYLFQIGIWEIENRILALNHYLVERLARAGFQILSPLSPSHYRSGAVLVRLEEPEKTVQALAERNILCTLKPEGMRVAVHFFNSHEDIDVLVDALGTGTNSIRKSP